MPGFNSTGNPFSVWNALNGRTVPMSSTDVEGSPTQQQQPFFSFRPNDIPVPQLDDTDELDDEAGPSNGRPRNDGPLFLSSDIDQLAEQPADARVRSQISGSGDNKRKRDESGSQRRPTRMKSEPKARKIEFEGQPYEVVRSDNPKGPHALIVNCSDGDVRKWPEHTDRTDQREALEANYYEGVGPESVGKGSFTTWAETLGKAVAGMLNIKQSDDEKWVLADFPPGYRLFIHRSGPKGKRRSDRYLFGCPTMGTNRFRSANEFAPHLFWLARQNNTDEFACGCRYCSETKLQSKVNQLYHIEPALTSPKSDRKTASGRATTSSRTGMSRSLLAAKKYKGPYTNKERDFDLGSSALLYRKGELVWAAIEDISDPDRPDRKISFWPGTTMERVLKPSAAQVHEEDRPEPGHAPHLDIQHTYQWQIKLLGLQEVVVREEADMLPYLAYHLKSVDSEDVLSERGLSHIWNPEARSITVPSLKDLKTVKDAAGAWGLAMQIVNYIISSWTLVDSFDLRSMGRPTDENKIHYQGIWWGAEMIWCGEMVRLLSSDLPDENCLAPSRQSEKRCFFVKIGSIYKTLDLDVMVTGDVYELCPTDPGSASPPPYESSQVESDQQGPSEVVSAPDGAKNLPAPPVGYMFRSLTPDKGEHHLDIQTIAGRYYGPDVYEVPMEEDDDPKSEKLGTAAANSAYERACALAGLRPAMELFMKCKGWKKDRVGILKGAKDTGMSEVASYCKRAGVLLRGKTG